VQSPDTSVDKIHQAMVSFLRDYKPDLATQFKAHQLAVVNELTEKPKNLAELTNEFWQDLNASYLQFNSKAQLKKAVEGLEPKAFAVWYNAFMADVNARTLLFYSQNPALNSPKESANQPFLAFPVINNFTDYKAKQPQVKYP
jgi:secreted Zn-dependent insulinase-like peptidase